METPLVYPQDIPSKESATFVKREGGMTLLDYFAAKAMQSILVTSKPDGQINLPVMADNAYMIAAWMLATRDDAHRAYPEILANRQKMIEEAKEKSEDPPKIEVVSS